MYPRTVFGTVNQQYGENLVLLVQTIIMIYLVWHYSSQDKIQRNEKMAVILLFMIYGLAAATCLPEEYRYLLHALNDILIVYAGGLQIRETVRIQHTGAQSIVTTSMNLVGELIRIVTTWEETGGDIPMLLSYGLCATLSVTMVVQYVWYRANTRAFYQQQQRQQSTKTKSE